MPLVKHVAPKPEETAKIPAVTEAIQAPDAQVAQPGAGLGSPKPVYTGRKAAAASDTMSKADWAAKDSRISLQGVLQALLSSVSFGQYCTGTTADAYLTLVEQNALRLAKFVKENAE